MAGSTQLTDHSMNIFESYLFVEKNSLDSSNLQILPLLYFHVKTQAQKGGAILKVEKQGYEAKTYKKGVMVLFSRAY